MRLTARDRPHHLLPGGVFHRWGRDPSARFFLEVWAVLSLSGSPLLEGPRLIVFIFLAEMCVVTLATLRTIFLSKGMRVLAPLLGFFEVSLWLFAIGEVMRNLADPRCSFAFALGFTTGTYLGILTEQGLALGSVVVRTVTNKDVTSLLSALREAGYGVTSLPGEG